MASRSRGVLLLFSFLLCCSLGEEHRRQKRGLVKMMMHVMWDPVRLIRYWHAYDVTKEIAKSWRKIIPTMVLHPYLGDTPGVAKYLNPTHGLTSTPKKQTGQFKYPDGFPADGQFKYPDGYHTDGQFDYIQSLLEQSEAQKNSYDNQVEEQSNNGYLHSHLEQSESSKNLGSSYGDRLPRPQIVLESASSSVDSTPVMFQPKFRVGYHYKHLPQDTSFAFGHGGMEMGKNAHHVYLQPVAHQDFKRDNRDHLPPEGQSTGNDDGPKWVPGSIPIPFPYHIDVPSSGEDQQIFMKAVPMPAFYSSAEVAGDHAASSNIDSTRMKNVHLGALPDHFGSRHPGFTKIQQDSKQYSGNPGYLEGGRQEIHIILHPIPVRDGDQHPHGGQSIHFVPYNFNGNKSSLTEEDHFSFALPHIPSSSHEEHGSPTLEPLTKVNHHKTLSKNVSHSESNSTSTSAEVYDAKQTSRVTWVLKKIKTSNRPKIEDTDTDESVAKPSSVDGKDDSDHTPKHPLRLKGHRIDIKQLREDLKHGTPVLIPFDKKVKLPQDVEENQTLVRNPVGGDHLNIRGEIHYGGFSRIPQLQVEEDRAEDTRKAPHYSSEEYGDNNATQRLLLFLAKKHSSQH